MVRSRPPEVSMSLSTKRSAYSDMPSCLSQSAICCIAAPRIGRARSRCQRVEQRLRLFQIACVEPFRKPPIHRSQQFARLLHLALVAPEACEAHGGAEFPGFCLLLTRDSKCAIKMLFCFFRIW